ncbi:MAG: hypothetical protein ACI37S_03775 [Candidatus Gastranaerophilaceae bacterium]
MKDIKNLFKKAADKIKSAVEKKDIPVADAFAQMDADLAEAEKDFEYKFDENAENRISIEEFYLNILGFKSMPSFDDIKARFEELVTKYNPKNFENDKEKQFSAAKKIDALNKAYSYFAEEENKKRHKEQ